MPRVIESKTMATERGTTLVVSLLDTQPPTYQVAELAAERRKVSDWLGSHYLADLLNQTSVDLNERGVGFTEVHSPKITDYPLTAAGILSPGDQPLKGGGYGEAAIASNITGMDTLAFGEAVTLIAQKYADPNGQAG